MYAVEDTFYHSGVVLDRLMSMVFMLVPSGAVSSLVAGLDVGAAESWHVAFP